MGIEAQNQFPIIDFKKSIMIGDTNSDIQFGKRLGMKTILYKSSEKITENIDLVINDFKDLTIRLKR
jgi:histidinol phosphatase-like enzyme